jgi:single-strand DNA-binding protein
MPRQDVNRVLIMGNLTKDPEVRTISTGKEVANFIVAVNRGEKNGNDLGADFVPVTAWGNTANAVGKYLSKGKPVFIEGRLHTSNYEKDGEKRFSMQVTAQSVKFLPSSKKKGQQDDDTDQYPTEHMKEKADGYQSEPFSNQGGDEIDIPF